MKKKLYKSLFEQVKYENLKNKMIDIFKYKIGATEKSLKVYYSNLECDHYKLKSLTRENLCEKDEFCEFKYYISFDKYIIKAGFNIFIYLLQLKEHFPKEEKLQNFCFNPKN